MPEGFDNIEEAQLDKAPKLLNEKVREQLQVWWFGVVRSKTNTPNFDIASTCTIEGKKGLLLIEAKAHTAELTKEVKRKEKRSNASENSKKNHENIATAILSACGGLQSDIPGEWRISRDSHYQMSNRFAWSWKLTKLEPGFPVILVYLGFLNAKEMEEGNEQKPFVTHAEWKQAVEAHSQPLFPKKIWDQRLIVNGRPFVPLIRSMDIRYDEPIPESEV
jgi:hypothetical protein